MEAKPAASSAAKSSVAKDPAAEALLAEVRAAPFRTNQALAIISRGRDDELTLKGIEAAAALLGRDVAELLLDTLDARGERDAFAAALSRLGAALPELRLRKPRNLTCTAAGFTLPPPAQTFITQAKSGRCRIDVDQRPSGSGYVVGPSLVLTAWHVVGPDAAAQGDEPADAASPRQITVRLSNGRSVPAVGTPVLASRCTDREWHAEFVDTDADDCFADRNDFALIRLCRPEGTRVSYTRLKALAAADPPPAWVVLFHYPDGKDTGIGFACVVPNAQLTARWTYTAATAGGSSGGSCFDFGGNFIGIHNGRDTRLRRLVPAGRFLDAVNAITARDIAPPCLWRLDEDIVIGRDRFFEMVNLAAPAGSRVRGLRIKRIDSEAQGERGLFFSKVMLEHVLRRRAEQGHRILEVSFEGAPGDILDEITRQTGGGEIAVSAGLKTGNTTSQATTKARARALTDRLAERAAAAGEVWWFFLLNAQRSLSADELMGLEEFCAAAITHPGLRVVMAGFELVGTPGPELTAVSPEDDGEPGFLVEIFGAVEKMDVSQVLRLAATDFGRALREEESDLRTGDILRQIRNGRARNGRYDLAAIEDICAAIKADLWRLAP